MLGRTARAHKASAWGERMETARDSVLTGAMELGLAGRRVLVTGGSLGIGFSVAKGFLVEGCHVTIAARDGARLASAVERLSQAAPGRVAAHAVDLAQRGAPEALAEAHPETDILVNNAGAIPGGSIAQIDEARWREAWDLKVFGYINMTRRFYALMAARKRGVIINVIGAAGENPDFAYVAGSSGNASLMAFTRAMGGTAPRDGLRVVGINPGPVLTERLVTLTRTRARDTLGDPERWQELMQGYAFGRAAKPEEIGWMAAFLASDLSGYTTGTIVTIDGGGGSRRSAL